MAAVSNASTTRAATTDGSATAIPLLQDKPLQANWALETHLSPLVLRRQSLDDVIEMFVRQGAQFFIGTILNWMRHPNKVRFITDRAGLRRGGFNKFLGGNTNRWQASVFQVLEIMRTARRTGTSVSQAFDDNIALVDNSLLDIQ